MSDVTREEMGSKLEALESRSDAAVTNLASSTDARFVRIDARLDNIDLRLSNIEGLLREMRGAVSSLKSTIILTGISSTVAIVLGVAAFNAALTGNMIAAMSAGKEISTQQAETRRLIERTQALLDRVEREHPAKTTPESH